MSYYYGLDVLYSVYKRSGKTGTKHKDNWNNSQNKNIVHGRTKDNTKSSGEIIVDLSR